MASAGRSADEHPDEPGDWSDPAAPQHSQRARREPKGEPHGRGTIVVKIGGSTLGSTDSSLQDVVTLHEQGLRPVVVHGGGKLISEWMERQGVRPRFVRGLRVTDPRSLEIVVGVLTGLVNKSLVASILTLGGRAMGISGVDGGLLVARVVDPELGRVGAVVEVNLEPVQAVLDAGCIPVIAPVAVHVADGSDDFGSMLNVNADTAAGAIAAALRAERLVFLTDVEGVLDTSHRLIPRLTGRQARGMVRSNIVGGGMVPKLEACLTALGKVESAHILDGRKPGSLLANLAGGTAGTRVG